MPEAISETWSFDHLHKALFIEKKADSVHDSPCLESLDWIQCYRETEPHPHAHTELPRGERSPRTAITGEHANVISCVMPWYHCLCTVHSLNAWVLHGILLPLHGPATQFHQQSLQTACTRQTHHHGTGRLFLWRLSFSRTYFSTIFVPDHNHHRISEQYTEEAVCAIVLKQMSHFYFIYFRMLPLSCLFKQ